MNNTVMKFFFSFILLFLFEISGAQKVFNIWPAAAPGSESWQWKRQVDSIHLPTDPLSFNIVEPTLTYFPADPALSNGTSVIICPGGSFMYLHIYTEGIDVARWLNKIGVSAFVLEYRLAHCETDDPMKEKNDRIRDSSLRNVVVPVVPMCMADGKQAMTYVRKHAVEFNINPNKIGIMGFSAGGTVAVAVAFNYSVENRPDFLVPVYAFVPAELNAKLLPDAPPAFIVAASDDELHLVPMSISLYNQWLNSGHPAELHIYSKGGHGFGMNKQNWPSDTWINRLADWMQVQGLLKTNPSSTETK
jgi:acetyl esterase/lipase